MFQRIEAVMLTFLLSVGVLSTLLTQGARAETAGDPATANTVKAVFMNVGKADAALLMLGDKRYLIDTGTKDSADAMLRALAYYQVSKLDGVFITHTDSDHVGGLKALLKSDVAVAGLYAPSFYNMKSLEKHPVYKQAQKYAVPLTWLNAEDSVSVSDAMRFDVLGPLTHDTLNENNNSLVMRLVTPQGDMMLTGDMEIPEEQALLAAGLVQSAAVLKVGHHGEQDASSEGFLYTVKPQIAVISTNTLEEPDTPDPAVLGRLWNIGAEVFVTQKATCGVQVTLSGGNAVGRLVDYEVD